MCVYDSLLFMRFYNGRTASTPSPGCIACQLAIPTFVVLSLQQIISGYQPIIPASSNIWEEDFDCSTPVVISWTDEESHKRQRRKKKLLWALRAISCIGHTSLLAICRYASKVLASDKNNAPIVSCHELPRSLQKICLICEHISDTECRVFVLILANQL